MATKNNFNNYLLALIMLSLISTNNIVEGSSTDTPNCIIVIKKVAKDGFKEEQVLRENLKSESDCKKLANLLSSNFSTVKISKKKVTYKWLD